MRFELGSNIEHILVLGAGASVDYGLPIWKDLNILIKKKIQEDKDDLYEHKKEMLAWIEKIDDKKKYITLDECLKEESAALEYHSNGHQIENQIFSVIKDIFNDLYKDHENGWIRILNEKILDNKSAGLENKIAFINYNYDTVLDKNLLNFTYLPQKHQLFNFRNRLSELSEEVIDVLFPHGNLFSNKELESTSHVSRHIDTMKSGVGKYVDVVSCYESRRHSVKKYNRTPTRLYFLGLGGGLQINLGNIDFLISIDEIHVTIKDSSIKDATVSFLSEKYGIPATEIRIYDTCDELVRKCFNN